MAGGAISHPCECPAPCAIRRHVLDFGGRLGRRPADQPWLWCQHRPAWLSGHPEKLAGRQGTWYDPIQLKVKEKNIKELINWSILKQSNAKKTCFHHVFLQLFLILHHKTCLSCSNIALGTFFDLALLFWTGYSIMFDPRLGSRHSCKLSPLHLEVWRLIVFCEFSSNQPNLFIFIFKCYFVIFGAGFCLLSFQDDTVTITFIVPFGTTGSVVHLGSRSSSGKLGLWVRCQFFAALSLSGGQDSTGGLAHSWGPSDCRLGSGMSGMSRKFQCYNCLQDLTWFGGWIDFPSHPPSSETADKNSLITNGVSPTFQV